MAGHRDPWDRNTLVIEKPPSEIIESATPAVTFFSNAGNLRLIECFLWLVWLFVVIALAFVARQIFFCARRNVEGEDGARDGANGGAKKRDEEMNELDTFSNGAGIGGHTNGGGGDALGLGNAYDGDIGRPATRVHAYWWSPWVLFRSQRDAGVKARIKNVLILLGIVLFYCIICYILTVITIVTFVKMTEGSFCFSFE